MRISVAIVAITLFGAAPARASTKPAAEVKAAKGPVQISLRLQKTAVKTRDSLWYKLELKNIGKKKLKVYDRIFKDPYAIHVNSKSRYGIYIEILEPNGNPLSVKWGNYRLRYDWEGPEGTDYTFSPDEKKEITDLQVDWKKSGMTAQQQSLAWSTWVNKLYHKKNMEELRDPARQHWLLPGASTATFAWTTPGDIVDYPGRAKDEESLRQGYTEMWFYKFLHPGKYRIRAVYDQTPSVNYLKKHKIGPDDERVQLNTPYVEFVVLQ